MRATPIDARVLGLKRQVRAHPVGLHRGRNDGRVPSRRPKTERGYRTDFFTPKTWNASADLAAPYALPIKNTLVQTALF